MGWFIHSSAPKNETFKKVAFVVHTRIYLSSVWKQLTWSKNADRSLFTREIKNSKKK